MHPLQGQPPKTVFFQSLGCPKNLVDAEVMLGISSQSGYCVVEDPAIASVIVVNTCSFINDSKSESIEAILELSQHRKSGTCKRLIVTGCLPQRYKPDLKVSLPEVDAFVGTGQYAQIMEFIEGKADEELGFKHPKYIHSEHTPRINSQPKYRAYLKVSEGCIKNCAFCIIPKIRGTLRSRTIPSLVLEAKNWVRSGVVELNLIAQDLTDYGRDLRNSTDLFGLLDALSQVNGLKWIRLLYVYPDDLSDRLLSLINERENICKYIDMPLQHISDRMLTLMNRKVSSHQLRHRLTRIRSLIPGVSLRSTLLVGYPGESLEEFNALKNFVKEAEFDHLGVFAYSHEENTESYSLPDQLGEDIKLERRGELMEIQQKISYAILRKKIGTSVKVLVEGQSDQSEFLSCGRHQGQAPEIDGHVLLSEADLPTGKFVEVRIKSAMEYDLIAAPIRAGFKT